jgi:hypothetical protein
VGVTTQTLADEHNRQDQHHADGRCLAGQVVGFGIDRDLREAPAPPAERRAKRQGGNVACDHHGRRHLLLAEGRGCQHEQQHRRHPQALDLQMARSRIAQDHQADDQDWDEVDPDAGARRNVTTHQLAFSR